METLPECAQGVVFRRGLVLSAVAVRRKEFDRSMGINLLHDGGAAFFTMEVPRGLTEHELGTCRLSLHAVLLHHRRQVGDIWHLARLSFA